MLLRPAMRVPAAFLLLASAAPAQFKSTVPLVVAPTTITDAKGRYVDGLTAQELVLYDNNVAQAIQLYYTINPISLVVAVQAGSNSVAVLDKLGRSGILFTELIAADGGETALVAFSDTVRVIQDFTAGSGEITHALHNLRAEGDGAAVLDALLRALEMLENRPPERRRIVLLIAEKRDRSSRIKLPQLASEIERRNVAIYWLTFSPFLAPFSNRPKTVGDREPEEERGKNPKRDEQPLPPELAPGSLLSVFTELAHRRQPDAAQLVSRLSGARTVNFLKQKALENAIQAIGAEVHRQYVITFQPPPTAAAGFHTIRVQVKGRPELTARTRAGYWPVQ